MGSAYCMLVSRDASDYAVSVSSSGKWIIWSSFPYIHRMVEGITTIISGPWNTVSNTKHQRKYVEIRRKKKKMSVDFNKE